MVNANLSPHERAIDANHQYSTDRKYQAQYSTDGIRNRHKCSECAEYFHTKSQLRNHFGHSHKVVEVSGSD